MSPKVTFVSPKEQRRKAASSISKSVTMRAVPDFADRGKLRGFFDEFQYTIQLFATCRNGQLQTNAAINLFRKLTGLIGKNDKDMLYQMIRFSTVNTGESSEEPDFVPSDILNQIATCIQKSDSVFSSIYLAAFVLYLLAAANAHNENIVFISSETFVALIIDKLTYYHFVKKSEEIIRTRSLPQKKTNESQTKLQPTVAKRPKRKFANAAGEEVNEHTDGISRSHSQNTIQNQVPLQLLELKETLYQFLPIISNSFLSLRNLESIQTEHDIELKGLQVFEMISLFLLNRYFMLANDNILDLVTSNQSEQEKDEESDSEDDFDSEHESFNDESSDDMLQYRRQQMTQQKQTTKKNHKNYFSRPAAADNSMEESFEIPGLVRQSSNITTYSTQSSNSGRSSSQRNHRAERKRQERLASQRRREGQMRYLQQHLVTIQSLLFRENENIRNYYQDNSEEDHNCAGQYSLLYWLWHRSVHYLQDSDMQVTHSDDVEKRVLWITLGLIDHACFQNTFAQSALNDWASVLFARELIKLRERVVGGIVISQTNTLLSSWMNKLFVNAFSSALHTTSYIETAVTDDSIESHLLQDHREREIDQEILLSALRCAISVTNHANYEESSSKMSLDSDLTEIPFKEYLETFLHVHLFSALSHALKQILFIAQLSGHLRTLIYTKQEHATSNLDDKHLRMVSRRGPLSQEETPLEKIYFQSAVHCVGLACNLLALNKRRRRGADDQQQYCKFIYCLLLHQQRDDRSNDHLESIDEKSLVHQIESLVTQRFVGENTRDRHSNIDEEKDFDVRDMLAMTSPWVDAISFHSSSFLRDLEETDARHQKSSEVEDDQEVMDLLDTHQQDSGDDNAVPVAEIVLCAHLILLLVCTLYEYQSTATNNITNTNNPHMRNVCFLDEVSVTVKNSLPRQSWWLYLRILKAQLSLQGQTGTLIVESVAPFVHAIQTLRGDDAAEREHPSSQSPKQRLRESLQHSFAAMVNAPGNIEHYKDLRAISLEFFKLSTRTAGTARYQPTIASIEEVDFFQETKTISRVIVKQESSVQVYQKNSEPIKKTYSKSTTIDIFAVDVDLEHDSYPVAAESVKNNHSNKQINNGSSNKNSNNNTNKENNNISEKKTSVQAKRPTTKRTRKVIVSSGNVDDGDEMKVDDFLEVETNRRRMSGTIDYQYAISAVDMEIKPTQGGHNQKVQSKKGESSKESKESNTSTRMSKKQENSIALTKAQNIESEELISRCTSHSSVTSSIGGTESNSEQTNGWRSKRKFAKVTS